MEYYIWLNKKKPSPGPPDNWKCLLPGCDGRFSTFDDAITHLDVCEHLKATTRQYSCPCCQADVRVPPISHGNKIRLNFKKSLETILGRSSSAGSSPVASPILDAGSSQERYQAAPMPNAPDLIKSSTHAPSSLVQHNRNVFIDPIITQSLSEKIYVASSNDSFPSSTTTNSPYGSGFYSPDSAQGPSSASSMSQPALSPSQFSWLELPCRDDPNLFLCASNTQSPCNVQHFGGFPYQSTSFELPVHAFSPDITNMQLDGENMEAMMTYPLLGSNTNINHDDVGNFFQEQGQWVHQESHMFVAELPVDLSQERYPILELASGADISPDLLSPTSTDISRADTLVGSEGNLSPTTTDSQSFKCRECPWVPDMKGNRSLMKLKQAVEKHFKRNHRSKDYHCPVCNQSFRNRPDNVKPHVVRKHPDMLAKLYPPKAMAQDGFQDDKATKAPGKPAIKRNGRGLRPQRV